MEPEYTPPPGSVAQPSEPHPIVAPEPDVAAGERVEWASDGTNKTPRLNLLQAADAIVPQEASGAEAPVAGAAVPAMGRRRWLLTAVVGTVVVMGVGVGMVLWLRKPAAKVAVQPTPTPTPIVSSAPTPSLAPSTTLVPTAAPTPAADLAVTAPAATPTADHPQAIIVTSPSGLWLRSSPTSVSRSNIIGWMPKGAQVSVDQVGDFWWHGVYKGQPGYFASKYTQ